MPGRLRDKPKHTAYAFGELRGSKAREAELELAEMEGGDALIDDLIETADLLKHGFKEEPELFLTSEQRERILSGKGRIAATPAPIVEEVPEGAADLADAVLRRGRYARFRSLKIAAAAAVVVSAVAVGSVAVVSDRAPEVVAVKVPVPLIAAKVEVSRPVVVDVVAASDEEVSVPEILDATSVVASKSEATSFFEEAVSPEPPEFGFSAPVTLPLGGDSSVRKLAPIPSTGRSARLASVDEASGGGLVSPYASPLSTFPLSSDPSVYANIRQFITRYNYLPPWELVSVADMVNYFPYNYEAPTWDSKHPISVTTEIGECPWAPERRLVRVAIKARPASGSGSPRNVVILVDTSKPMLASRKLPMAEDAIDALLDALPSGSLVSIVPFGEAYHYVFRPAPATDKRRIKAALTALASGVGDADARRTLKSAVGLASRIFGTRPLDAAVVITDSVGPRLTPNVYGKEKMLDFTRAIAPLRERTREGVAVFGVGNEMLSFPQLMGEVVRKYRFFHCGSLAEAQRAFGALAQGQVGKPVARGVRAEVEFNPETVRAYRLVGTLGSRPGDKFDLDKEFELQPGQEVTAFYEIIQASPSTIMVSNQGKRNLRYTEFAAPSRETTAQRWDELMALTASYGRLGKQRPGRVEALVYDEALPVGHTSESFRFGAAVAGFGMLIGGYDHRGDLNLNLVLELANSAVSDDPLGLRREFIELVDVAGRLGR